MSARLGTKYPMAAASVVQFDETSTEGLFHLVVPPVVK
jgi:hypothetical protein